jgi:hypothetical protein
MNRLSAALVRPATRHLLIAGLLGAASFGAQAACSGSGTSWSCTAGSTVSDVQTAINSASTGATLSFAPGAYTWSSRINLPTTRGVSLVCSGTCTVAASGLSFSLVNWSGVNANLYRISGFTFNNPGAYLVWFYQYNQSGTLTKVRIDNNKFNMPSGVNDLLVFGESGANSKTKVFGVIDRNTFTTSSGNTRAIVHYGEKDWAAGRQGSADNLFIENNNFDNANMANAGLAAVDGSGGVSWVVRYNRFRNGRIEHHGYYSGGQGYMNSEVYGNTVIMDTSSAGAQYAQGERAIKHQGSGEWIVFDNTVTALAPHGNGIVFQNYRSSSAWAPQCNGTAAEDGNRASSYGYPCNKQLGRDVNRQLRPMYIWNNKWSDSGASVAAGYQGAGANDLGAYHLVGNRDFYTGGVTAQSGPAAPFNGASGVGFGTLANRPATCTTGAEAGGGVAYWATDTRTLYRCSAANTWTAHYRPYTYPHPLVQGTTSAVALAAPTALRVLP